MRRGPKAAPEPPALDGWKAAVDELEGNADLDPGERHRLANIVRDHVDELERGLAAGAQKGADVLRKVVRPAGPRERSVVAWRRGTSFSIKADGPEDSAWFEELASDPPAAFRVRPALAAAEKLADPKLASQTWERGIRANVACVRLGPKAEGQDVGDALEDAIDDVGREAGDWIVMGLVRRNVGGHSGRALIVTFGFVRMDEVQASDAPAEDDEDEGGVAVEELQGPKTGDEG